MRIFGVEEHQLKRHREDTERIRSPAETVATYRPVMEAVGITRLANVTGLDCVGIPVYMAVRPNARSLAVSQGKGIDCDAARASAMMESIELWHAERIVRPLRHDSYRALAREGAVVDVDHVMLRPRAVLRKDVAYEWIAGEDLLSGAATWVPFEAVTMNTVLSSDRTRTFASGTNGLASGNHILEAIVHAILEVIERDAVTLFHCSSDARRANRRIDPKTIDDDVCCELIDKLARADLDVALWDVTSDLGVPVYMAAIVGRDGDRRWRSLGLLHGSGAHLSSRIALSRAITEAAQARLTVIAGSRDDNPPQRYVHANEEANVALRRALYFNASATARFDSRSLGTTSFEGDVKVLLDRLIAWGIAQVVAIPLTRAEYGLPVVKIMAAGLESYVFAPGFRPGVRARAVA
ncbi:MAG: YcaO-like family protein [Betaproteobacteria bacterium]